MVLTQFSAVVKGEAGVVQQAFGLGLADLPRAPGQEGSRQGSGNGIWLPAEVTSLIQSESRQPSPAPRINEISATSTSTELDLEGKRLQDIRR